ERPEFDFSLTTMALEKSVIPAEIKERVITNSRACYSTPRHIVEEIITKSFGLIQNEQKDEQFIPVVLEKPIGLHKSKKELKETLQAPSVSLQDMKEKPAENEIIEKIIK